ncbi:MAG: hypothetical protein AAGF11_24610 [Myxococcota bacterium]
MWLETITVRMPKSAELERDLPTLVQQLTLDAPTVHWAIYARHPSSSDLSLHFQHLDSPVEPSPHGLRLAEAFRAYGAVDHVLWTSIGATAATAPSR